MFGLLKISNIKRRITINQISAQGKVSASVSNLKPDISSTKKKKKRKKICFEPNLFIPFRFKETSLHV